METLGLGTPVIAWARGGTPEIIESGLNGWLVDQTADFAAALSQLKSTVRRRQVGLAGRARILNTYAPDVVYPGLAEVYAGAMHGWCPPDSTVYHEAQAERAWSRLLVLFENALA